MRRLPSLNALRFFDSAARQLSFSLAAKELCVTHSAVSQQIRQLEQWFDCPLFEPRRRRPADRRRPGPAARGRGRLRPAGAPLRRAQAQHPAFRAGRGRAGQFPSNWLIPGERFEAAHPDIRIRLQTAADAALLNTRRVDALILAGRDWPREGRDAVAAEATGPVCAPAWAAAVASGRRAGRAAAAHQLAARGLAGLGRTRRLKLAPRHPGREFDHLGHMLEAPPAWAWPSRRPCWLRPSCIAAAWPRRWASSIAAPPSAAHAEGAGWRAPALARLRDGCCRRGGGGTRAAEQARTTPPTAAPRYAAGANLYCELHQFPQHLHGPASVLIERACEQHVPGITALHGDPTSHARSCNCPTRRWNDGASAWNRTERRVGLVARCRARWRDTPA